MLVSTPMCKESSYAKMEKLGLKYVGAQDRALKLSHVDDSSFNANMVSLLNSNFSIFIGFTT